MNVKYVCPKCGARLFAAPGGTKIKCSVHDVLFVQVEAWNGPDFLNIDSQGNTKSKGHINTPGYRSKVDKYKTEEPEDILNNGTIEQLQAMYLSISRTQPDKRWGQERLRAEIIEVQRLKAQEASKMQEVEEKPPEEKSEPEEPDSEDEPTEEKSDTDLVSLVEGENS